MFQKVTTNADCEATHARFLLQNNWILLAKTSVPNTECCWYCRTSGWVDIYGVRCGWQFCNIAARAETETLWTVAVYFCDWFWNFHISDGYRLTLQRRRSPHGCIYKHFPLSWIQSIIILFFIYHMWDYHASFYCSIQYKGNVHYGGRIQGFREMSPVVWSRILSGIEWCLILSV